MLERKKMFHVKEKKKNQNGKLIINWTRLKNGKLQYRQTLKTKNRYQLPLADPNQIRKLLNI